MGIGPIRTGPRTWLALIAAFGTAGTGISIYLTAAHYAKAPLVCSANGVVNCERVVTSAYSSVAGVPISAGGICWFALTAALALAGFFSRREPAWLQPVQVALSAAGLAFVIYLIGVEVVALGVICAWCTALHILIASTLLVSLLRPPHLGKDPAAAGDRPSPPHPNPSPGREGLTFR